MTKKKEERKSKVSNKGRDVKHHWNSITYGYMEIECRSTHHKLRWLQGQAGDPKVGMWRWGVRAKGVVGLLANLKERNSHSIFKNMSDITFRQWNLPIILCFKMDAWVSESGRKTGSARGSVVWLPAWRSSQEKFYNKLGHLFIHQEWRCRKQVI